MNAKLKAILPSAILLLSQLPIAWAVLLATVAAKQTWIEVLGRGAQMPSATEITLSYGIFVPGLAALVSTIFVFVSWKRNSPYYPVLFGTALVEAMLLAFIAWGLMLPYFTITWSIGHRT